MSVKLLGPMEGYTRDTWKLVVDGCLVPHVIVCQRNDTNGLLTFTLDDRFSIDVPMDQIDYWGWIVANAMAIGAGYSCHGPNSRLMNPFACQVHNLDLYDVDQTGPEKN